MKKIGRIILTLAQITTFVLLLFFVSILIIGMKMDKENEENPYCLNQYADVEFDFSASEVEEFHYQYECNTLYVYLTIKDSIDERQVLVLLTNYMFEYQHLQCFFHFEIHGPQIKSLFASIDLKNQTISYNVEKE